MSLPTEVQDLLEGPRSALAEAMAAGHPIAPEALAGHAYLGISIGLPSWVDRALWKTFVKAFASDARGWNVKMAQHGLDGPHAPLERSDGRPRSFGHFSVSACPAGRIAGLDEAHVLLDYSVSDNPVLDPSRAIRDPLVSLRPGSAEVLLGRTYAAVLGGWLGTPSYFALVRSPALQHLADPGTLAAAG
jgi:hypothetical protein